MKKLLLFLFIASILSVSVKGGLAEETFDQERLKRQLPEQARTLLASDSSEQSILHRAGALFLRGLQEADRSIPAAIRCCLRIFLVAVILSAVRSVGGSRAETVTSLAGAIGISAIFVGDLNAMFQLGEQTVLEMSDFSKLLIPTVAGAAAVSGAVASSAAIASLTTVLMQIFTSLLDTLVLPLCGAYVALCTASSALRQESLQGLSDAVGGLMKHGIRIVLFLFTAILSLTGILSEASDAASIRAAKLTLSASVPVAGSILSDAAVSVLAGAKILLQSVGVFGMLGVLSIAVVPFLRMGVQYLFLQFTGFCCTAIGASQQAKLVSGLSTALGCLLAVTAGSGIMVLVSCVCLVRLRTV